MARLLFPPHYLLHSPKLHFSSQVLLLILCILPVTFCSAERSFSGLKRIKTPLRSTMGNERLSFLALLHVHRDIDINVEDIIDEFNRCHARRLQLATNCKLIRSLALYCSYMYFSFCTVLACTFIDTRGNHERLATPPGFQLLLSPHPQNPGYAADSSSSGTCSCCQ